MAASRVLSLSGRECCFSVTGSGYWKWVEDLGHWFCMAGSGVLGLGDRVMGAGYLGGRVRGTGSGYRVWAAESGWQSLECFFVIGGRFEGTGMGLGSRA